jgi:agmatinase
MRRALRAPRIRAGANSVERVSCKLSTINGGPLTRYAPADSLVSPRFTGVPTFARLPLVNEIEDVDLAVVGVPFDTGVTNRPGGRFAPNAIRAASIMIRQYNPNLDVKPFEVLSCIDYGDIAIVPGFIEASYEAIERELAPLFAVGVVPILLGGDHSCTLAHLRAAKQDVPLSVVVSDSHTDAWDNFYGQRYTHGTWVRRAIEEELMDPETSILVGLRGSLYDAGDWDMLGDELGLAYIPVEDVIDIGPEETARRVRERIGRGPAYFSFDIDSVDPAYAPGTGTPEAGGLTSVQALRLVRALAGLNFVGFDLVEVIPAFDPAGVTANLAANIAWEMLSIAALQRQAQTG